MSAKLFNRHVKVPRVTLYLLFSRRPQVLLGLCTKMQLVILSQVYTSMHTFQSCDLHSVRDGKKTVKTYQTLGTPHVGICEKIPSLGTFNTQLPLQDFIY